MPTGEGWFLDTKTGKAIQIAEHEAAVRADPQLFRLRPEETVGRDRAELLKLVFQRGFIRVRWDESGVVFEFHGGRRNALRLIREFLLAKGAGLYTRVRLHDLADDTFGVSGYWEEIGHCLPPP